MQKTEPACLTNVPTDNQPTPFYIHAYNAYNVTQDTAALDAPSPPSNTDSLDNNQASESSLPPETTSLSKTQQDLLQIHHCLVTLVSASFKIGLATDNLNYLSPLPNARHQYALPVNMAHSRNTLTHHPHVHWPIGLLHPAILFLLTTGYLALEATYLFKSVTPLTGYTSIAPYGPITIASSSTATFKKLQLPRRQFTPRRHMNLCHTF